MKPLACNHSISVLFLALWHTVYVFFLGRLSYIIMIFYENVRYIVWFLRAWVILFILVSVAASTVLVLARMQSTCVLWTDTGGKKRKIHGSNEQEYIAVWRKDNNYFFHCNVKCLLQILCLYKLTWKDNNYLTVEWT